jgi:ketosteroid isomerase-like protein
VSAQNVELVKAAFDAWSRGDIDSMLRLVDPEIVVVQPSEVPDAMTRHGPTGVMDAIAAWPEQWDDYKIEIVQIVEADDHVVTRTHQRGRGKGSGVEVAADIWFVFRFRNGKVTEWRMFADERDALEAAGLSE